MPRWRLVFSGWQYPMLPSRAVNIFVYFKVKKTRAKLVAKAITGLIYTWIDSLISWESSCYVVHFFCSTTSTTEIPYSSPVLCIQVLRVEPVTPERRHTGTKWNVHIVQNFILSKLLFNNAIGICVALKILEVKDLQFWSFESLIT